MKVFSFLLLILFLHLSKQQEVCDFDHPFRLLTRMSGKALFSSNSDLVLDYVDSSAQISNSDRWVICAKSGIQYCKNIITNMYISFDAQSQTLLGSSSPINSIVFDESNSVPGYTVIEFTDQDGNVLMVAYENDILHVSALSTTDLWAQWNKQPLDPFGFRVVDDCDTPFVIQNKGTGLFLAFGNAYPYDGFITPHYGSINWLVFNTCPEKLTDPDSKLWVLCNGLLRTKYQLPRDSPFGYYYMFNDAIRISSGFARVFSDSEINTIKPAYVDSFSSPGDYLIELDFLDYSVGPTPELRTFFLTDNGICGNVFQRQIDLQNADHSKWKFMDPINDP